MTKAYTFTLKRKGIKLQPIDEVRDRYNKRIEFLRTNIAPDDIYEFAEQALAGAEFFIRRWNEWVDVGEECEKDMKTLTWVSNILGMRSLEKTGYDEGIGIDSVFLD